jgi:cell shape-determining protein MreC
MTMKGRSQISSPWISAGIAILAFTAVVFFGGNFQAPVRAFVADLLTPSVQSEYDALSRNELELELREAHHELDRIRYQSVLYGLLSDENTELRKVQSVERITTIVPARILARPPRTHYDTVLVAAGSASGVSTGDRVVSGNILVGEVIAVTASSATVELLSTPQAEIDVLLGEPVAVAIARGVGGGAFEVAVPQGVTVQVGDPVRPSTDETLLLGVVSGVSGSPTDATKTVYVAAPVPMSQLDFVSVLPREAYE